MWFDKLCGNDVYVTRKSDVARDELALLVDSSLTDAAEQAMFNYMYG